MKRCPQCNTVFESEMTFCKEDGTSLIDEAFSMPSSFTPEDQDEGEQQTVIRNEPIRFDISKPDIPKPQVETQIPPQVNQYAPNHGNAPLQKQSRGCLKYTMFLIIGLVIGGAIALAFVGIGFVYMNDSANDDKNKNVETTVKETPTKDTTNKPDKKSTGKHSSESSTLNESDLNGLIIRSRATLRSTPTSKAMIIENLPKDDRIKIIQRKSSTSKWYKIECEHGSKGWIDGYSIEFTE